MIVDCYRLPSMVVFQILMMFDTKCKNVLIMLVTFEDLILIIETIQFYAHRSELICFITIINNNI